MTTNCGGGYNCGTTDRRHRECLFFVLVCVQGRVVFFTVSTTPYVVNCAHDDTDGTPRKQITLMMIHQQKKTQCPPPQFELHMRILLHLSTI